jgi:DNA-binding MarR family transcriptional regulator
VIKPKDASQTYLRFLNLVNAVRSLPSFPSLDAVEERVLNGLAAIWATGAKVTVLEAMRLTPDASPSTVHRRLKQLREKGLIQLREDDGDSRVRHIEPTAAANAWFAKLGQCMNFAARDG